MKLERIDQVRLCSPAQLDKGNLRKKRIATAKLGVNRYVLSGCVRRQYLTQFSAIFDKRPVHSRITVRPLNAWAKVLASVYSNSPPSGTPWAILDTVISAFRARSLM